MRPAAEAVLVAATERVEPRQLRVTAILCGKKKLSKRVWMSMYILIIHYNYIYIYVYIDLDIEIEIEIVIDR